MKILHICIGSFFPDGYSYQENILPKYHKILGYDTYVIAGLDAFDENGKTKFLESGSEYINENGIKVVRLNFKGNLKFAKKFKNYKGLYFEIEKVQPDILFIHNCQFICIREVVKYLKKHTNIRVYVDNHADFSNSATNCLSKNILHKVLWRHCAHLIEPFTKKFYGVLPARVDFLKNVYKLPPEKCELLVMGADDELVEKALTSEIMQKKQQEYGITSNDFVIVTGGKTDANKLQILLLMDVVNKMPNDIKLLIFGSVVPELKQEFEEKLSDKVRYIGWRKSEEIYLEFAVADLCVFPGLHSVLWEQAVGMGKPCLFKRLSGVNHIDLGGNCRFIENDTIEEITQKICDCMNHLEEMKVLAQAKGMDTFSYKKIAKRSIEE